MGLQDCMFQWWSTWHSTPTEHSSATPFTQCRIHAVLVDPVYSLVYSRTRPRKWVEHKLEGSSWKGAVSDGVVWLSRLSLLILEFSKARIQGQCSRSQDGTLIRAYFGYSALELLAFDHMQWLHWSRRLLIIIAFCCRMKLSRFFKVSIGKLQR